MKCAIYRWIVFIKLSNQNHSNHKIIIYSISHFVVNLYEQSFAIVWQVESSSNFAKKTQFYINFKMDIVMKKYLCSVFSTNLFWKRRNCESNRWWCKDVNKVTFKKILLIKKEWSTFISSRTCQNIITPIWLKTSSRHS